MNQLVGGIARPGPSPPRHMPAGPRRSASATTRYAAPRDRVDLGRNGAVTPRQAAMIITERSMEQVRQVIKESRETLRQATDRPIEPIPEAAVERIMAFALEGFERFQAIEFADRKGPEARQAYAAIIGPAMHEGVEEAGRILEALNAMNAAMKVFLSDVSGQLERRLAEFTKPGSE